MRKINFVVILLHICFSSVLCAQSTESNVDETSTTSLYIEASHGGHPLWNATAFLWRSNESIYVITNNHVVGGEYHKDEFRRKNHRLPPADSLPDSLHVRIYDSILGRFSVVPIPLFVGGREAWIKFYENKTDSRTLLDIVAIKVNHHIFDGGIATKYNDTSGLYPKNYKLYPSQDLFIVGFPLNYGKSSLFPIWKRGTIASEPNFDELNISQFFIDATTRSGMSGSPVYYKGYSNITSSGTLGLSGGMRTYLVGIYSAQSEEAELGVVTKFDKIAAELSSLSR